MKTPFEGQVLAVKARIRLIRSFDQIPTHQYQGYTLVLKGNIDGSARDFKIAIGPKAHEKHMFRIGDKVAGEGVPVPDPNTEWSDLYKVSQLTMVARGPGADTDPPGPDGGIAPALEVYRSNGHRRLDRSTWEAQCLRCPWGLDMVTEIIVDHWKPWKKRWRFETHCYGPKDCPRYNPGKPYRVPGRSAGMVYVDDDVERQALENARPHDT
jgi:hypothetical protein